MLRVPQGQQELQVHRAPLVQRGLQEQQVYKELPGLQARLAQQGLQGPLVLQDPVEQME